MGSFFLSEPKQINMLFFSMIVATVTAMKRPIPSLLIDFRTGIAKLPNGDKNCYYLKKVEFPDLVGVAKLGQNLPSIPYNELGMERVLNLKFDQILLEARGSFNEGAYKTYDLYQHYKKKPKGSKELRFGKKSYYYRFEAGIIEVAGLEGMVNAAD